MYSTYDMLLNDIEKVAQTTFLEDNIISILLSSDNLEETIKFINSFDIEGYNPFILFILGHKYRLYCYLYKDLKYPKLFLNNIRDIFEIIYQLMGEDHNILISLLEELTDPSINCKIIIECIIIALDKIFNNDFENKLIMKMRSKGYQDRILEDTLNMKIMNIVDNFKKQLNNLIIPDTL